MFILKRYLKKVAAKLKPAVPAPWVREQALEGLREAQRILGIV